MKYLIIGAMPEEVHALHKRLKNDAKIELLGVSVIQGSIGSHTVSVALSGVGKVNAAYTATSLIHALNPDVVLNIGSAGGLQTNQSVGDVVVATKLQYHDLDIGPNTHTDSRFIFESNPILIKHVQTLLTHDVHYGLMVTGDQFITKEQRQFEVIQNTFPDAMCVEMEACAIAAVCKRSQTPFLVLRSLSDIPLDNNNAMTFEEYLPKAAENSAAICERFIETYHQ